MHRHQIKHSKSRFAEVPKNQKNIQAALALLALLLNLSFITRINADSFTNTGSMTTGRGHAPAILLPNGNVLVVGGFNGNVHFNGSIITNAEVYNPNTGLWSPTGSPQIPGFSPRVALLLPNGKVLVAGGETAANSYTGISSSELYDPATGTWTLTGPMNAAVYTWSQAATLLPNGKVLVMGGQGTNGVVIASAELYDPATGLWTPTGTMHYERVYHRSTLLPNGKVLVTGGENGVNVLATAELYDPATGVWTLTGTMSSVRDNHTATLLPNGKVLITGGHTTMTYWNETSGAEIYDPATGLWTSVNPMQPSRDVHTATLLPNGKVLVTGGQDSNGNSISSAEIYDPASGAWTTLNTSMSRTRMVHSAILLPSGNVLLAGGLNYNYNADINLALTNAELFLPFQIQAQPQSQICYLGQAVSFSVTAVNGNPPLKYQWLQNSVAISGATNTTLTLNNLQTTNAGAYTVVITDASTNVLTSQQATLAFITAPTTIALYAGATINGVIGESYGIQTLSDLTNTNSWVGVANLTLTTPTQLWYDSEPATQPQRFYRVVPGPISIP